MPANNYELREREVGGGVRTFVMMVDLLLVEIIIQEMRRSNGFVFVK